MLLRDCVLLSIREMRKHSFEYYLMFAVLILVILSILDEKLRSIGMTHLSYIILILVIDQRS